MYAFRSSRSDLSPEGASVRPSASRALFSERASSMIVSRWLRCRTGAMVGTPKDNGNWSAVRSARASVSPLAAGSSQVFLRLAEGHSLSFQPSLLVGRNGGVEPSGGCTSGRRDPRGCAVSAPHAHTHTATVRLLYGRARGLALRSLAGLDTTRPGRTSG